MQFTTLAIFFFSATVMAQAPQQYSNEYMVCLVNKARAQNGLSALGIDPSLTAAAQEHSNDMARSNNMDHTGSDGSSPGDRCQQEGFNGSAVAENIAFGQSDADSVMQSWLQSPGHRENIMNPEYTMMGSAVSNSGSTPYYTQDFGCDGKAVRNVPTCDGNYPDAGQQPQQMSSSGGSSGGGGNQSMQQQSSGGDSGSYGGDSQPMQQQQSYGGSSGGGGRKHGGGRHQMQQNNYGDSGSGYNMQPEPQQQQSSNYGGGQFMMPANDFNSGSNFGGSQGGAGRHGGGGFSSSNADWFQQQGFGQSPYGGGRGGGQGGMMGGWGGAAGPIGGFHGAGF